MKTIGSLISEYQIEIEQYNFSKFPKEVTDGMFQRVFYLIESKYKDLTDCKFMHLNNPVETRVAMTNQKHIDEIIQREKEGVQTFKIYFRYLNKLGYTYFVFTNAMLKDPSLDIREAMIDAAYKWAQINYEK